jgi:PASTA domain/Divergent InlB B-repeat domain
MRPGISRAVLAAAGVAGALALTAATPAYSAAPAAADPGSGWQQLTNAPPFNPGVMLLLTDGRVMVQNTDDLGKWWLLTPDAHGGYARGTWTQPASLPAGYTPLYAADAVLPDGRLILEGGEYNGGQLVETNKGAIYDPVANAWQAIAAPKGAAAIGDAPSVVLADGSFMLGPAEGMLPNAEEAILDPSTLTWTPTGSGKADNNGEEGFTLLPNGHVLTVDADASLCTTRSSEVYSPVSGGWASAGATPSPLVACSGVNAGEIGPQILMYDGKVFVEGSTSATALYDTLTGTWASGPLLPTIGGTRFVAADAPSAILPDGKVLLDLSPGVGTTPSHFFLFDGASITQIADDVSAADEASNYGYMLMLPTGQVLFSPRLGPSSIELYSDGGTPNPAWAPQIAAVPSQLAAGQTYALSGTQLNGLSDGAAFGDDYQTATDYPLVQITDDATGTVTFARTSGMTNRSIAPGASSCTNFTLPAGIPQGSGELRVIANGIASSPVSVSVGAAGADPTSCPQSPLETLRVSKVGGGRGRITSSPAGIACGSTCLYSFGPGTSVTLTAAAGTRSRFAGWSGACSGIGACTVTMTARRAVVADFEAKPAQERCVVPRVKGKRLAAAKRAIARAGCRIGKVRKAFSAKVRRGRVISQKPRPKATIAVTSPVTLTVSKGKRPRR